MQSVRARGRSAAPSRSESGAVHHFHTTEYTMKAVIEIRAAEGGTDAKLLCKDQLSIILAYAERSQL